MTWFTRARPGSTRPAPGRAVPPGRSRPVLRVAVVLAGLGLVAAPTAVAAAGEEPAAQVAPAYQALTPAAFGAVGDGSTDDTAALRRALAALQPGQELFLPAGRTYRHTDTLRLTVPGTTIAGTGTLLATDPQRSALIVQADDVTVRDVTLRLGTATSRLGTFDHMKLTVIRTDGFVAERVKVRGSAAAGVYLWGATDFVLRDLDVRDTKADGVHVTGPSSDGSIQRPVVRSSGDDGVAVVSYLADGQPVRRVSIDSPTVLTTTWGRGVSVVGGEDVTITNLRVERSNAAAVYVAREGAPWNTFAPVRVTVRGGTLAWSNTSTTVDHGAVLVYDGRSDAGALREVTVSDLTITGTRSTASRQVGFLRGTSQATGVRLTDLSVLGGPRHLLTVDAPAGTWTASGWTRDGVPVLP
jgi:hypothetical protein